MKDLDDLAIQLATYNCGDKNCNECPFQITIGENKECISVIVSNKLDKFYSKNPLISFNDINNPHVANKEVIVTGFYFTDTGEAIPKYEKTVSVKDIFIVANNILNECDTCFITLVNDYINTSHYYSSLRKVSLLIEKGENL